VLHVRPRRYRFRWLNSGPSRFYQIYLTDLKNLNAANSFWQISNDGNLLPTPVQVPAVEMGVAERADVIIDFTQFAGKTLYLENRLEQVNGRGPTGNLLAAGQGNLLLQIVVDLPAVPDNSVDPATGPKFYALPSTNVQPLVKREFKFDVTRNGQWTINDQFFDCNTVRFTVQQNSVENWQLDNGSFPDPKWTHPIHIHFEEFQFLDGAPGLIGSGDNRFYFNRSSPPSGVNAARKDVSRLLPGQNVTLFFRFRDFLGRYPMHCHNVIHEDHAMMLRWDIAVTGDTNSRP
jgi:FtsP/CotA-like multicopper oxidase with cupredoxin domain